LFILSVGSILSEALALAGPFPFETPMRMGLNERHRGPPKLNIPRKNGLELTEKFLDNVFDHAESNVTAKEE
jgi:hypothetical protein